MLLLSAKSEGYTFESDCHIWHINIKNDSYADFFKKLNLLSNKEKEKFHSFKFQKNKLRFITSHVALRSIIKYYTNIPIHLIKFNYNQYGKLYLANKVDLPLFFNLSHAHNKAVIAINCTEVGVDIEHIKDSIDIYKLTSMIFSKRENHYFMSLSSHREKLKYFYTVWTKKEAYLKSLSIGLVDDLKEIHVGTNLQSRVENKFVIQNYRY